MKKVEPERVEYPPKVCPECGRAIRKPAKSGAQRTREYRDRKRQAS